MFLPLAAALACSACADPDAARRFFAQGAPANGPEGDFGLQRREADGVVVLKDPRPCGDLGEYHLRSGVVIPLALTAPHVGHDRHTGAVVTALFAGTNAAAAAWNTAPRSAAGGCPGIDLADAPDHLFTRFALGFADRFPSGLIVQLHGFDGDLRASARAGEAAMIVSDGASAPDRRTLALADCLSIALSPSEVLVYPLDTSDLGATSNAQGKALREAGKAGFVHLELSQSLRAALLADSGLQDRFARCLTEAAT